MLRPSKDIAQVFVYRQPIDFRKSYNGLAAIVEQELQHDPFSGHLYLFTNKGRNKVKILLWERNGFVLYYKSLQEEKFHWPKAEDTVVVITGEQLNFLLDGYNINAMKPHRVLRYKALC